MANEDFQHILRVLNTNVDGKQKIMFALTSIKGIGRRFSNICCKKADVDMNKRFALLSLPLLLFSLLVNNICLLLHKSVVVQLEFAAACCGFGFSCFVLKWALVIFVGRAGELSAAELDSVMTVVANPRQFKIPDWFLNRKKDYKDGKYSQVVSNALDMKLRDDLERLKKIRSLINLC